MATKTTSIWNQQLVEASSLVITAGVPVDMLVSPNISNEAGTIYNSLKVTLEYQDLLPANVLGSFFIGAVVETKNISGVWDITNIYQFSALRKSDQPPVRVLMMQPNMDTFNLGVDDSVFPNDRELCRISRAQGLLPEAFFRVRLILVENDPLGANAFVSVKVSAETEQYNA